MSVPTEETRFKVHTSWPFPGREEEKTEGSHHINAKLFCKLFLLKSGISLFLIMGREHMILELP